MTVETRSFVDDREHAIPLTDHLYCAVDGERLGTSWRFSLAGIDEIELGRGAQDAVVRDGPRLRIDRLDAWMSQRHARFVRDGVLWVVEDAGARNGVRVNGLRITRAFVDALDVIELGRSFFFVRRDERAAEPVLAQIGRAHV